MTNPSQVSSKHFRRVLFRVQLYSFTRRQPVVPTPLAEKNVFLHWNCLDIFGHQWPCVYDGLFLGSQALSPFLCLCGLPLCVYMLAYMCAWRPEVDSERHHWSLIHLIHWRGLSMKPRACQYISLASSLWPVSAFLGCRCGCHVHLAFEWVPEIWPLISSHVQQVLQPWAVLSVLLCCSKCLSLLVCHTVFATMALHWVC